MDRESVITHLQIIHTWAEFASKRDLEFFTAKHLEDIAQWTDDAIGLLKEQEAENGEWITIWQEDDPDTSLEARCSVCGRVSKRPLGHYCKWCGSTMDKE